MQPGPVAAFSLTGLANQTQPNVSQNLTVTATDMYGNPVGSYTGSVTLTSTDPRASLPGTYTYSAADAGSHVFAVALDTAGNQTVTATSGSVTSPSAAVTIQDAIWQLGSTDYAAAHNRLRRADHHCRLRLRLRLRHLHPRRRGL